MFQGRINRMKIQHEKECKRLLVEVERQLARTKKIIIKQHGIEYLIKLEREANESN